MSSLSSGGGAAGVGGVSVALPSRPAPPPPEAEPAVVHAAPTRPPAGGPAVSPLVALLLRQADGYRARNALRNAAELYFTLVERHPETEEAVAAREQLLQVAAHYERLGAPRQARAIYERLL